MSKYKEHIYLTMLRKRGNYISHHLDKMEEGPLKVLRDKPIDTSLRQIKSIFGVYQILLLEIVNDLKFSELEEFAMGIQKLFKQVIASSLHFVKGLLKSIQKNYQGSTKEQSNHNNQRHLTAQEEQVERRIYQFKQKFYFNLQEQAKAQINSQDPEDQALQKLHQQIQIAKEGILSKNNSENSVSTYLKEIIQHFNKSCYGSKLIIQNAENEIKNSDDQLKETEEMHNLLERAVSEKQKKMRMIRRTLNSSQLLAKKPTASDFAQTDQIAPCKCEIGFSKQQKKTLKKVSHNKQYTQTSQQSEFDHNKTIIENHELNQQLMHTNKRVETLSCKALELKDLIEMKNEEIEYLQAIISKLQNPSSPDFVEGFEKQLAENPIRMIQSFKAKREYVGFKRKFMKSSFQQNENPRNESIENNIEVQQLIGVDLIPEDPVKTEETPKHKDDFDKYSFVWEIIYDLVTVTNPNITKQQFINSVKQEIAKNNIMIKEIPKSKKKSSPSAKPKYMKMRNRNDSASKHQQQLKPKINNFSPPKTAQQSRRKLVIRNSINYQLKNQPTKIIKKEVRTKSTERFRTKVDLRKQNTSLFNKQNSNDFGPDFKMIEGENPNSHTFTQLISAQPHYKPFLKKSKSTTNYIRIKPKTLQLQFQQDKYIITLYRRYAEFRITEPEPCFRIVSQLGLTQIYNRGFISFDEFSLQASRYIDKHRNCQSRGDGIICSHLVNLASFQ